MRVVQRRVPIECQIGPHFRPGTSFFPGAVTESATPRNKTKREAQTRCVPSQSKHAEPRRRMNSNLSPPISGWRFRGGSWGGSLSRGDGELRHPGTLHVMAMWCHVRGGLRRLALDWAGSVGLWYLAVEGASRPSTPLVAEAAPGFKARRLWIWCLRFETGGVEGGPAGCVSFVKQPGHQMRIVILVYELRYD